MPIEKVVNGNLINLAEAGEFDIIAHGCNCFHTMRSGIAGELARRHPQVAQTDKLKTKKGDTSKLGKYTQTPVCWGGNLFTVLNMYTQYAYGTRERFVEYMAVRSCFASLATDFPLYKRIGIPMIGAGLAGGDWDVISEIIDEVTEHKITLVVLP